MPHRPHDSSYKKLFSQPRVVRDLLTGFVHEPWIARLDLKTLEPVHSTFISDGLRGREADAIWRVRFADGEWLYVYLLLEFQSTVDRFMALRIMAYVALLYQDLAKDKANLSAAGRLPPVLPLVLYNGERRWRAAQEIAELIEPVPGGLEHYRPQLRYLLLDEGAITQQAGWSIAAQNVAAAIFRLEHHRDEQDIVNTIGLLVDWLRAPEQANLRRNFTTWLKQVLLPSTAPFEDARVWQSFNELSEVHNMLAERVKRWPQMWQQRGREEGLEKGREEGLEKGLEQGREEGLEQGLEKGREETRLETARKLLERTEMDDPMIAELTGLERPRVAALRAVLKR